MANFDGDNEKRAQEEVVTKAKQKTATKAKKKITTMPRVREETTTGAKQEAEQEAAARAEQEAAAKAEQEAAAKAEQEAAAKAEHEAAAKAKEEASAASMVSCFKTVATETTIYSKKALENRAAFVERLLAAKCFGTAILIQSEYAKTSYADRIAYLMKIGELYSNFAVASIKRRCHIA
jgi:membrane protein involved in colicin uptake